MGVRLGVRAWLAGADGRPRPHLFFGLNARLLPELGQGLLERLVLAVGILDLTFEILEDYGHALCAEWDL